MLVGMRVLFMARMETLTVRCRASLARRFEPSGLRCTRNVSTHRDMVKLPWAVLTDQRPEMVFKSADTVPTYATE